MSRRAARVTRTSYLGRLATRIFGRRFRFCFLPKLAHKIGDIPIAPEGHIVAAFDIVKAFLNGGAEPFEFGLVFPLAPLQEPESFANHFARVAEAARGDAGLDETVEVFGEIDVAGWHLKILQ